MFTWWESMGLLQQIFFLIAAPSTIIMVIQVVMLIVGGGLDLPDSGLDSDISGLDSASPMPDNGLGNMVNELSDFDGDLSADSDFGGLRLFSVNGILAFLTVCGWSGVTFQEMGLHEVPTVLLSFALGAGALYAMALLIRTLLRLAESGNADYRLGLGKIASVYLTIPSQGKGQGKINLLLGDQIGEFWATTDHNEPIPTGSSVRIIDLSDGVYTVAIDN